MTTEGLCLAGDGYGQPTCVEPANVSGQLVQKSNCAFHRRVERAPARGARGRCVFRKGDESIVDVAVVNLDEICETLSKVEFHCRVL